MYAWSETWTDTLVLNQSVNLTRPKRFLPFRLKFRLLFCLKTLVSANDCVFSSHRVKLTEELLPRTQTFV